MKQPLDIRDLRRGKFYKVVGRNRERRPLDAAPAVYLYKDKTEEHTLEKIKTGQLFLVVSNGSYPVEDVGRNSRVGVRTVQVIYQDTVGWIQLYEGINAFRLIPPC